MSDSNPIITYNKAPFFQFAKPLLRQNDDGNNILPANSLIELKFLVLDSLEIECSVEAQPIPEIKWFYNNVRSRFSSYLLINPSAAAIFRLHLSMADE